MAAAPRSSICPARARMGEELARVHAEIAAIQKRQIDTLLRGDFEANVAVLFQLDKAQARLRDLTERLTAHITEHGC